MSVDDQAVIAEGRIRDMCESGDLPLSLVTSELRDDYEWAVRKMVALRGCVDEQRYQRVAVALNHLIGWLP